MKNSRAEKIKIEKFLSEYLLARYTIQNKKDIIEEKKAKAETIKAVTYDKEKVAPTNKITDPMQKIDTYIDETIELQKMIVSYSVLTTYITEQISRVKNKEHRELLLRFYIQKEDIKTIKQDYKVKQQAYIDINNAINELTEIFKFEPFLRDFLPKMIKLN